jgi:hypothetical protein
VTRQSPSGSTSYSTVSAKNDLRARGVILVDTSGLLAALVSDQRAHAAAARTLRDAEGPFVISPFVLAELDYLVSKLAGPEAALALLDEVARGAYRLAEFSAGNVGQARRVMAQYVDLGIGLADASIVVLAHALGTRDILTLDERHFRALRGPQEQSFRLLPRDA